MDDVVNWFVNSKCNLSCEFCFRDMNVQEKDTAEMLRLVGVLAENGVKRVTIGGGEPLLRRDLETILKALKSKGIFVSLHTNGTILKPRINKLVGLVDILSLPIDSTDDNENKVMRGRPYVALIEDILRYAPPLGFRLAFKTTASKVNRENVVGIYDLISRVDFEYWKVYQFRPLNDGAQYDRKFRLTDKQFESLREKLHGLRDARVHPIDRRRGHQPYLFLDNQGNISTIDPIAEQNVGVGNCYEIALARMGEYVHSLHGLAGQLPGAERVSGRVDGKRSVVEAVGTNYDEAVALFDRSTPDSRAKEILGGVLKSLLPEARGIKVRVISSKDPDDPRLAYYGDD